MERNYSSSIIFSNRKTDWEAEVIYEANLDEETVSHIEVWDDGERIALTIDELLAVKIEAESHLKKNILKFLDEVYEEQERKIREDHENYLFGLAKYEEEQADRRIDYAKGG